MVEHEVEEVQGSNLVVVTTKKVFTKKELKRKEYARQYYLNVVKPKKKHKKNVDDITNLLEKFNM